MSIGMRALIDDRIVEGANVEPVAELLLGLLAQLLNFQPADHVAERLPGQTM